MANTWQGDFPLHNTGEDGYDGTAPVGSYPPNGYGLFDMTGNVWEWTSDWYERPPAAGARLLLRSRTPVGASARAVTTRPSRHSIPRKVMKGGSHLCAPNYCRRYRPAARMAQPIDTSTSHLGFRCISRG